MRTYIQMQHHNSNLQLCYIANIEFYLQKPPCKEKYVSQQMSEKGPSHVYLTRKLKISFHSFIQWVHTPPQKKLEIHGGGGSQRAKS